MAGLYLAIGIFLSGIIQTLAVAFGLGSLMQQVPVVAVVVKSIGALYLAWLGYKMLKSWWQRQTLETSGHTARNETPVQLMRRGMLANLLNPKALLFFSLFLPQFTTGSAPLVFQIIGLGLLLGTIALTINIIFAFGFSKMGRFAASRFRASRHIEGFLGVLFIGLAARLATSK